MERMTLIVPRSKSISPHFKPNISLCRNPVEAARRTNVRSRRARPSISALISAGARVAGGGGGLLGFRKRESGVVVENNNLQGELIKGGKTKFLFLRQLAV